MCSSLSYERSPLPRLLHPSPTSEKRITIIIYLSALICASSSSKSGLSSLNSLEQPPLLLLDLLEENALGM